MTRFDRYMLSQLLMLFGFFSLVLVSVYWVNRAVSLFDELIGDGQSAVVFLEFTLLMLPNVIRLVLPISAFVAAVHVTNRLITDSEVVVMQAAGLGPWRLARPVVAFGLIVAALLWVLMHGLVPASRAELARRSAEIAENVTARFLAEGRFLHPADGLTLFIDEITPAGELRNLLLVDARGDRSRTTFTARRAVLAHDAAGARLVMIDGMAQTVRLDTRRLFTTRFADFTYDIAGLVQGDFVPGGDMRALPTRVLLAADADTQARTGKDATTLRAEAHERFAQPVLAPGAALIGFAALLLGSFSRFGVGRQIFGAVVLLIVVHMANNAAGELVRRGVVPMAAIYAPAALAVALAAGLLWATARARRPRRDGRAVAGGAPRPEPAR